MILLQTELSGVMAEWLQGATSLAAIIISIVIYRQSKKIKELEDITRQLENHNATLSQRLSLELALSLEKRMPICETSGIIPDKNFLSYRLTIGNVGKKAFKIHVLNYPENIYEFIKVKPDSCGTGGNFSIELKYLLMAQYITIPFDFTLSFHDNANIQYTQRVFQLVPEHDYFIDLPRVSPESLKSMPIPESTFFAW